MCDRRVLETLGHDSLIDLAASQCRVIQEQDAAISGLKAERDILAEQQLALLTPPWRIATGMLGQQAVDPSVALQESWDRWKQGNLATMVNGDQPSGADVGEERAPGAAHGPDQEPMGHGEPGVTTPGGGASSSEVPQSADSSWRALAKRGPRITWPDRVRDCDDEVWELVDAEDPNLPHYRPEDPDVRPWMPLEVLAREWGPLTVVDG